MIVHTEEHRARLRYLNCHNWNARLFEQIREFASDAFVKLKLNHQIHVLLHQLLRVPQRNLLTGLIVQFDQIHQMLIGSPTESLPHSHGERIMTLRRVADAKPLASQDTQVGGIFMASRSAQEPLVLQCSQQTETCSLLHPRPLHNLGETQLLTFLIELAEQGAGARDCLELVAGLLSGRHSFPINGLGVATCLKSIRSEEHTSELQSPM